MKLGLTLNILHYQHLRVAWQTFVYSFGVIYRQSSHFAGQAQEDLQLVKALLTDVDRSEDAKGIMEHTASFKGQGQSHRQICPSRFCQAVILVGDYTKTSLKACL